MRMHIQDMIRQRDPMYIARNLKRCPRCQRRWYAHNEARGREESHEMPMNAISARLSELETESLKLGYRRHSASYAERAADPFSKEDHSDAVSRMRFDTNRLTYAGSSRTPISLPNANSNMAKMDRRTSEKMRVAKAREQIAVHRTKRDFEKSKEYIAIEEAYRPMPNSLEGLQSLAEERIDEARRAGAFKDLDGKGKALELLETKTPLVDRTEFFLNQIIKKQGALPPFVDAQASLDRSIAAFRASIRAEWTNFCCKLIALGGGTLETQVHKARIYGEAESRGVDRLRDAAWEKRESRFIQTQLDALNSAARGYNIIAPFNSRRGYLKMKDELEACYRDATPLVAQALVDRSKAPRLKDTQGYKSKYQHTPLLDHVFGKAKLKSHFYEKDDVGYGFGEWFRDTFRRQKSRSTYD